MILSVLTFNIFQKTAHINRTLYGINNVFVLSGEWLSIGASYAVEADIDDPDQALVPI